MDETRKVALFRLGQVVATPGALRALEGAGDTPQRFLELHVSEDWGDLDEDDRLGGQCPVTRQGS